MSRRHRDERHENALGARGEAEAVLGSCFAGVGLVAGPTACGSVAVRHGLRRHQAVRARNLEAGRSDIVHGAIPAAQVIGDRGAGYDYDVCARVRRRAVDEGDLGVSGGEPGEDVRRGRCPPCGCGKLV